MLTTNHLGVASSSLDALIWGGGLIMATTREKFILHTHFYVIYFSNYQSSFFTLVKNQKDERKIQSRTIPKPKANCSLDSATNVCTKLKEKAMATRPQTVGRV
jgi:hypothetical protein